MGDIAAIIVAVARLRCVSISTCKRSSILGYGVHCRPLQSTTSE